MSSQPGPQPSHPDATGVVGALAGDREAERELCRRLLPAVRAFALRRLDRATAEDFSHDVLVLVVEAVRTGRVRDTEHIGSFALGICRNLARDRARGAERRQLLLERFGMTEDDLISFDTPLEVRRAHLEDCYSQLTQRARSVIRATFCEEFADAEIAQQHELSAANVRVIRHRSLAALRECLERPISWVQR